MAVAAQPTPAQAAALQARYGPGAGLAFQRSQYLADALQSLQQSAQDNIRTPTALATNLLADGILQWGKHRADQQAMTAFSADRQAQDSSILKGLQPPPDAAPQPPEPSAPQAPPPASPPLASATPPPMPASAPAAPTPDQIKLAQMVWGEARGEPPEGQQATAAVALNRAKSSGQALADVISAPHQFEGYNDKARAAPSADIQRILSVIQPELAGADPTGGATNFLNPALQAQLGRQMPAWAQGPHQTFGHQDFYGGDPTMAQAAAPQPPAPQTAQQPPMQGPGGPPGVQPYQVASNGPTPPPPGSPPAGPPPQPAPSPGPQAGGGAAPQQPGLPTGPAATQQEVALVQRLLADPRTHDQGVALGMKLQERMASPVDPTKPYWGQDGRAHYAPGTTFTDQPGASPNQIVQRGPDNQIHVTANPAYGALPAGTSMNGQGAISQQPIQQQQTFRIPNVSGVFTMGPDGRPVKVGDDQYGPSELLKMRDNLLGSEPVKLYQQAADAYGSMVAAAQQNPGGMRAYALRDTFARAINPGAVARVGTIQAIRESQGLPAEIKGFFMNLQGDGNVPPEIAQQILDVTQGFVASHYRGAQQLVQSNADYATRHQIDPRDVTVPIGDAPQRFVIQPQQAAAAPNPAAGAQAAIAAEIARRKAAGKWP